jgi:hypothetical protein
VPILAPVVGQLYTATTLVVMWPTGRVYGVRELHAGCAASVPVQGTIFG